MPIPTRRRIQINFTPGTGRTRQAPHEETDINAIMEKWRVTGELPRYNTGEAKYGDFSSVDDYMTAQNAMIQAQEAFASLPARVRDRMANDPQNLIEFVNDPENLEEARALGLLNDPDEICLPEHATGNIPNETPAPIEGGE